MQHPSLRPFKLHVSLLQAQFAHWQHRTKFARTQIRNLLSSFQPTDPPYIVYSAYLAAVSLFTAPAATPHPTTQSQVDLSQPPPAAASSPGQTKNAQDIHAALSTVQTMEALSIKHGHTQVTLLAHVLRLRVLVAASMWTDIEAALQRAETALGLSYNTSTTPRPTPGTPAAKEGSQSKGKARQEDATFISFEDPFEAAMAVHLLVIAVGYFTHIGDAASASPRLSHLHALLDSSVLDKFCDGVVHVRLRSLLDASIYEADSWPMCFPCRFVSPLGPRWSSK